MRMGPPGLNWYTLFVGTPFVDFFANAVAEVGLPDLVTRKNAPLLSHSTCRNNRQRTCHETRNRE